MYVSEDFAADKNPNFMWKQPIFERLYYMMSVFSPTILFKHHLHVCPRLDGSTNICIMMGYSDESWIMCCVLTQIKL